MRALAAGLMLALAACVLLWPADAAAGTFNHERSSARERVLRSPTNPSTSSSNYAYRAFSIPAGAAWVELEYDYVCSGSTGITCQSQYWTSGPWQTMQSLGTGHNSGQFKYSLPTGYTTIWILFRYSKGSFTGYQDMMWVDDIRVTTNLSEEHVSFPAHEGFSGWTIGGTNGGFTRAKLPLARAAGPSENMGANTTVDLSRWIYFPASSGNSCAVTYATDIAPTHKFRVYEGANLLLEATEKSHGTATLALSDVSGWKQLKLQVYKDGQADGGRDLVRVKGMTCYTSKSTVVGHYDFDGQAIGSSPYAGWSQGCTGSCSGIGWRVFRATPHDSYVSMQSFGSQPYVLDGYPKEYIKQGNATRVLQFDALTPANKKASLDAFATTTSLHLYWRLNAATPGSVGDESGYIYLLLDERRGLTLLRGSQCGAAPYQYPSAADRAVYFYYSLALGAEELLVQPGNITQEKGACNGGWAALGIGDVPVAIEAYIVDSGSDALGLEMKIDYFGSVAAEQMVGLGLLHYAYNPSGYREALPFHEYGASFQPQFNDVYSWETVRLTAAPTTGVEPTERVDGCCIGRRDWL